MSFQDDRLPYLAHHHGHHVGVDLGGIVVFKPIECSEDLGITLPLLPHLLDQKADHFNRRGGGVLDLAVEASSSSSHKDQLSAIALAFD